jgi:hypothetical protein
MNQSQATPEPDRISGQMVTRTAAKLQPNDRSVAGTIPRLEIVPDSRKSANVGTANQQGHRKRKETPMLKNPLSISLIAALSAFVVPGLAQAQQSQPSLAGTYRCVPEPESCKWQGQSLTISQTGSTIKLNINTGETADAKLTSPISLSAGPPFNALGHIMPDKSIEWTNGTKWVKQ